MNAGISSFCMVIMFYSSLIHLNIFFIVINDGLRK
jgi:hypothetical protein